MSLMTKASLYLLLNFLVFLSTSSAQKGEDLVAIGPQYLTVENQTVLALKLKIEQGWHIYFLNPGDSGLKTEFEFQPAALDLLSWPMPETFKEAGDLWTHGHHDEVVFFFAPTSSWNKNITIQATVTYLVCKEICIPGKKSISIKSETPKIISDVPWAQKAWEISPLKSDKVPKQLSWELRLADNSDELWFYYEVTDDLSFLDFKKHNLLYPLNKAAFGWGHEELRYDQATKKWRGRIKISWDGKYQDPVIPLPTAGKVLSPIELDVYLSLDPRPLVVQLAVTEIRPYDKSHTESFQSLSTNQETATTSTSPFALMVLFAFLGGLILNFMPCVLPVITLKFFQLVKQTNRPGKEFYIHNFMYGVGVLSSMLVLAGSVILLKSLGHSIGWGFQMQSPIFVFVMLIVLFIMTLNLFGLFEWKMMGGGLTKIQFSKEHWNHFWSGVLTTALSTPCSAPLLGSALTFAFSQSDAMIIFIFIFIGLGLSFPFILISLFPKMLHLFPKPGAWMEVLKHLLGLSMLISTFWLMDVLVTQVPQESDGLWNLLLILGALFFIIHNWKKRLLYPATIYVMTLGLVVLSATSTKALLFSSHTAAAQWGKFDASSESALRNSQEIIFVDFTAKWCITCQVNKKLVMETADFQAWARAKSVKTYRADWTQQDPWITEFLKKNNVVSVPAYFFIKGDKTHFIGETISMQGLENNLQKIIAD